MTLIVSRVEAIAASPTLATRMLAQRMRAEGKDVLTVSSGEPEFDTPDHIKEAAIAAIRAGATKYTDVLGTRALRRAVAAKFREDNGIDCTEDEVVIATGSKQVIFNALLATIAEGDEAIIPAPCWVSYPAIVSLAGGKPVILPCRRESGFKLLPEELERAITDRTKWVILNNPCNPTGAAYDADELRALGAVLLRHPQVFVLTDDIYEKLVYDEFAFATLAQAEPRLKSRTMTVNGCSKSYAMTGWRIGYGAGPRPLIVAINKVQGHSTSNASSVGQAAALAALTGPQECVLAMREAFARRRDCVVTLLNEAPGLSCHRPQGAFYAFPDLSATLGR